VIRDTTAKFRQWKQKARMSEIGGEKNSAIDKISTARVGFPTEQNPVHLELERKFIPVFLGLAFSDFNIHCPTYFNLV